MKQKRQAPSKPLRSVAKPRRLAVVRTDDAVVLAPAAVPLPAETIAQEAPLASVAQPADDSSIGIDLAENCVLRDAAAFKEELLKLKDVATPVIIRIGAVQRIETANLQVLGAFVRDRIKAGRSVQWSGESRALSQAVKLLGLNVLLDFDVGSTA